MILSPQHPRDQSVSWLLRKAEPADSVLTGNIASRSILSVLIDEFEFCEREPGLKIERKSAIVTRPVIVGEENLGLRMPLKVSLAKRDT